MFDAKSILEQIMGGANPSARQPRGQGSGQDNAMPDLGDLLRQFTEGQGRASGTRPSEAGEIPNPQTRAGGHGQPAAPLSPDTGAERGSILDELMRQFAPDNRAGNRVDERGAGAGTQSANPLEDLLRQFQQKNTAGSAPAGDGAPGSGGGLGDLIGDIFGKGRQAAGNAGQDAQDTLRNILEKIGGSGAASGDMMRQLTDFINNNKLGAGAALGGLGALVLGTKTGRSIAMSAAKIGALAVVGGLAYKAYQNYSQGRPLVSGSIEPEAAPAGSGFEADQVSNAAAVTYIRGMIAAAAADGRIDEEEQNQIIGALSQQGIDSEAETFLANELNNPASIDELVGGVSNETEALQLYTAARVSIDPDTSAEQRFLATLADRLGISAELRAHVDAATRGVV